MPRLWAEKKKKPTSKWGWPWEESQNPQSVSAKFISSLMKRGFWIFQPAEDWWQISSVSPSFKPGNKRKLGFSVLHTHTHARTLSTQSNDADKLLPAAGTLWRLRLIALMSTRALCVLRFMRMCWRLVTLSFLWVKSLCRTDMASLFWVTLLRDPFGAQEVLLIQNWRPVPTATTPCCQLLLKYASQLPYPPRTIQLQHFYMKVLVRIYSQIIVCCAEGAGFIPVKNYTSWTPVLPEPCYES